MIPEDSGEPAAATEATEIPAVTVRQLRFEADRISLSDEAREQPFQTHYDGLSIAVRDLSTVIEEGKPYRIQVSGESGGSLQGEGTVSLPEARSEGRLVVSELSLVTLWRFAEPWLKFRLDSGSLSLEGDYTVSWQEDLVYGVDGGELTVDNIDITPVNADTLHDTWVRLAQLKLAGLGVDSTSLSASLGSVIARDLDVAGWSEGTSVSLAELFDMSGLPETETDEQPEEESGGAQWTASVGEVVLEDSRGRWQSEYTDPPMLVVDPVSARVESVRWPFSGDSPLALNLVINDETRLDISGALALGDGAGTLDYELQALPLTWLNPNLPKALKAHITDGFVAVKGDVALEEFAPARINVDGSIDNFSGQMAEAEEALTRWDSVRWQQLSVDLDQRQVSMAQLLIHDYEGRIHIREDGSINASNVWQAELGEEAEEIAEELEFDKPWQVDVPEILISSSAIDFNSRAAGGSRIVHNNFIGNGAASAGEATPIVSTAATIIVRYM